MLISTLTAPAINDLIKKSFAKEVFRDAHPVRALFHKETSDWTVDRKRIQELDRERFAETKVEGKASAQRGISQGYAKEIIRKTISVTRVITGEAYRALEAVKLSQYATQTGADVVDKTELDMRNFIGFGMGSSYTDNGGFTVDTTVGDGLALFHTAHTLKNSPITYSNILSGAPALNEASLDLAKDYFNFNVVDNNGQRIKMKPNTIITTSKSVMVNRVDRLFGSSSPEAIEGTANANAGVKNSNKMKYKHLIADFDVNALDEYNSAKTFFWLLGALGGMPETSFQAYFVSWMSPMTAKAEIDQDKWILSYTSRSAYGIGALNGKGLLLVQATA